MDVDCTGFEKSKTSQPTAVGNDKTSDKGPLTEKPPPQYEEDAGKKHMLPGQFCQFFINQIL